MQDGIKLIDDITFHLKLDQLVSAKPFGLISEKLGTQPKQLLRGIVGVITLIFSLFVLFFAHNLVFFCISILYPAFSTLRALTYESVFQREGKLWLSYWAFYGAMKLALRVFGFILNSLPFFNFTQSLFTIWLYNRNTKGAEFLTNLLLVPVLKKYIKEKKEIEQPQEVPQKNIQE